METAKQVVLRIDADVDALAPIDPASFAAGFPNDELRRQFVDGLLVIVRADGVPSPAVTSSVEAFAQALGVDAPELHDLRLLTRHHMVLFRIDFWRHGHIGEMMRNQLDQHGILGLARGVLGLRGLVEDRELAAKYRAWERLPQDTLGYAIWRYYQTNGFALPGERTGFPEAGLYHDFSHVLGGYDTDPPGEIEVAAFTAGYKQYRPIYVVLFAVVIFSTGADMRPAAGYSRVGILGEPGMAAACLRRWSGAAPFGWIFPMHGTTGPMSSCLSLRPDSVSASRQKRRSERPERGSPH
jgi:hypothetical protein